MNLKGNPNDSFAASSGLFANIFRDSKGLAELQQKEDDEKKSEKK